MNSVEQTECAERHNGLHIRLVSGFSLEIITEFVVEDTPAETQGNKNPFMPQRRNNNKAKQGENKSK